MPTSERLQRKSFDNSDEMRKPGRGAAQAVNVGGFRLLHVTLEPGWQWPDDVKPTAHTATFQANHVIQMISGRIRIIHEGTEEEFGPGDSGHIAPGHDRWVVGNEPAVYLDITGRRLWAEPT